MRPRTPSPVLRVAKTPAFLVTDPINVRYLTNVVADPGIVLLQAKKMTLFVTDLDRASAEKAALPHVHIASYTSLDAALKSVKRCGYEAEKVSVKRIGNWKRRFKNTKFVQCSGVVEGFRRTKSSDEIRKFKRSQRITRTMMARIPRALKPGITEQDLAWKLRSFAHELGAENLSFEPIVAFGTHTACPHHRPTKRKLKKGHLVQIDVGVQYQGYCSDQSQVFFTVPPSKQQKNVHRAVLEAFRAAKRAMKPGVRGAHLDRIARDVLTTYELEEYFIHTLGHGVGLEIHEDPRLSVKLNTVKLRKGEIVTIEPGVYIPGKFGMRIEEEVIVGM